jgi:hypothetical protein
MCYCEGVSVAVGDGEGARGKSGLISPTMGTGVLLEGSLETTRLFEQAHISTASARATENMANCEMRSHALPRINRLPGTGSRETGAQNSTGGVFMNTTLWWKPAVNR